MRHELRHAARPTAPTQVRGFRGPFRLILFAIVAAAAALGGPSSAGGPSSPDAYVVSHEGGSTYRATPVPAGSTLTGGLQNVVETAMETLDQSGGGTIAFGAGLFDLGAGQIKIGGIEDVVFEGRGIDVTILTNFSRATVDTEVFDVSSADRVQIRDLTVDAGGPDRLTSDAIDFDNGNDIVIERVKVSGSRGRGIVFDGKHTGRTADRNIIRDCVITGVPGEGIELLASSENVVERCTITRVGSHGIQLTKSSAGTSVPNK